MKAPLLRFLTVFALVAGALCAAEIKPPTFVPASGLRLSLNTSGYKFFVGESSTTPTVSSRRAAKLGGLLPTREGFAASAILANTSRTEIPFEFDDAGAAAVKFKFSVIDAEGTLIWQSDSDLVSAQVITAGTLGKGKVWKRMVQVPLKVDGGWLQPGRYTLEATLAATPSVSATTVFEVATFPEIPTGDSGIIGQVFEQGQGPIDSASASALPAPTPVKAQITIMEKRLPNARYDHPAFFWTGPTDENGKFQLATPPGAFIVTASRPVPQGNEDRAPTVFTADVTSAEVSVEAGKFVEVTLTFQAAPPATSGINGLVLIGPVGPIQVEGQPSEEPLAGAEVHIVEIYQTGNFPLPLRGPRSWTLTAGPDGKFTQATPPGKYRISASVPSANDDPAGNSVAASRLGVGTAEVTVPAGAFAEVTVHVDSGIR